MKLKTKYFFNNTWVGVILSMLLVFCYFIFVASCFVMGIISLAEEFKVELLLNKILSEETSVFVIRALAVGLGLFLTIATMMGTKLLIEKFRKNNV